MALDGEVVARVGDRLVPDLFWTYEHPLPDGAWTASRGDATDCSATDGG